jgi:hypothetical protein
MERTRYFARQLITPDDLTQDQVYFHDKMRRHNRMLHGWGIVCGAWVRRNDNDACTVVVEPGYILGPQGDEIYINNEVTVDLCREDADGNALSPCDGSLDIWCSDVRPNRQPNQTLYLAVRYDECHTRPVRTMPTGCADDPACEYSRVRDSYVFKVLTRLPDTYNPMPANDMQSSVRCIREGDFRRQCPPCPESPWVILADITLGADGNVEVVDLEPHRRYVVSFAEYYILCQERDGRGIDGVIRQPDDFTRVADVALMEMLDNDGVHRLEVNLGNDRTRAEELPAMTIRGVGSRSAIGRVMGERSIGEIADMSLDDFIGTITTGLDETEAESVRSRAPEIHRRAVRIADVSRSLRRG